MTNDERTQVVERIHCKDCHHALRRQDDNTYHHSGRAGPDCECPCEGQQLEGIARWSEIKSSAERRRERGEAAANRTEQAPAAVAAPAMTREERRVVPPYTPPVQVHMLPLPEPPTYTGHENIISNSEIQTYKRCKRRWYLIYYRKFVPRKIETHGPLALGTMVHAALADHVTSGSHPAHAVQTLYDDMLREMPESEERQKIVADRELAIIMLDGYVQWAESEGTDAGLRLVSAEHEAGVENFADTGRTLVAKLDVEVEREIDGAHLFRDWKTAGNFEAVKLLPLDEQMLTYMLIRKLLAPEGTPVSSGLYTMLRKVKRTAAAKPPFYMQVEAYHSEVELRNFYVRLAGTIRDIERVKTELDAGQPHNYVVPPTVDRSCTWQCPYQLVCPMMDDGSDYESALQQIAQIGDPYERYDIKTAEAGT